MAELVHQYIGADDGIIVDDNFTRHFCRVANDTAVAYQSIVGHVYTFHQEIVVADDGSAFGSCTAVDSYVFTYDIVVSDFSSAFLPSEL